MPAVLKELCFYCNLCIKSDFKRFSRSTVKKKKRGFIKQQVCLKINTVQFTLEMQCTTEKNCVCTTLHIDDAAEVVYWR